jgi:hypothetical protein
VKVLKGKNSGSYASVSPRRKFCTLTWTRCESDFTSRGDGFETSQLLKGQSKIIFIIIGSPKFRPKASTFDVSYSHFSRENVPLRFDQKTSRVLSVLIV